MDASNGRGWTFRELDVEAERGGAHEGPVAFPQTNCPEFVFTVLRAWRDKQVVCPLDPGQARPDIPSLPPEGIAHLKTPSATGGAPRMIAFSEAQLAADAENLVATVGLRPDWPNLGAISLAHSYGFSNLVLPLLLHGIPLILVRAALPEALKRAAATRSAVTIPGVPALWRMWGEAEAIPKNVRLAISAGAPLPIALERGIHERFGLKIHNFYGSSECGGIAYDAADTPRPDDSCVGAPVRDVLVSLNDEGCVVVCGDAVGSGYWPNADERLRAGTFVTSDLGRFDGGRLYLHGRVGDLINVAGRKVSPESIEMALSSHPAVRDCLAFGVPLPDGHRGESIVGCLCVEPGASAEALRQHAVERLPAWQVPREWWFVESLAANGRGKLSRAEWKARYMREGPGRNGAARSAKSIE